MKFEATSQYLRNKEGLVAIRWRSDDSYEQRDERGNDLGYRAFESLQQPADFDPNGVGGNVQNLEQIQFYSSGKFSQNGVEEAPAGSFTFAELSDLDKNLFLNAYWQRSFLTAEDQTDAHRELKEKQANLEHDLAGRNFIERHP